MDELNLYEKHTGGLYPSEFAFGREWRAMALYMDDIGSPTPEDAVLAWYHETGSSEYYFDHRMTDDELLDWFHNTWKKTGFYGRENDDDNKTA